MPTPALPTFYIISVDALWNGQHLPRSWSALLMKDFADSPCALVWDWDDQATETPTDKKLEVCHTIMEKYPQILQAHVSVNGGAEQIATWRDAARGIWRNVPNYPSYPNTSSPTPYKFPEPGLIYTCRDNFGYLPYQTIFVGTKDAQFTAAKADGVATLRANTGWDKPEPSVNMSDLVCEAEHYLKGVIQFNPHAEYHISDRPNRHGVSFLITEELRPGYSFELYKGTFYDARTPPGIVGPLRENREKLTALLDKEYSANATLLKVVWCSEPTVGRSDRGLFIRLLFNEHQSEKEETCAISAEMSLDGYTDFTRSWLPQQRGKILSQCHFKGGYLVYIAFDNNEAWFNLRTAEHKF